MKTITAPELKQLMTEDKVILVDVRSPKEFRKRHLPNAVNIDFYDEDFEENWKRLHQDRTCVLYCNHGEKSELALTFLASICDSPVYHLKGGIKAWKKCGFAVE